MGKESAALPKRPGTARHTSPKSKLSLVALSLVQCISVDMQVMLLVPQHVLPTEVMVQSERSQLYYSLKK